MKKNVIAVLVVLCLIVAAVLYFKSRGGGAGPHGKAGERPPEAITVDLGDGVKMEFLSLPPGKFTMGAAPGEDGAYADESPQQTVIIDKDIWIGKYEVTQAQWQRVMSNNPSGFQEAGPSAPVESVTWDDCAVFFEKLNALLASNSNGPALKGFRLPTEAEWEYACRAGTTTRFSDGGYAGEVTEFAWCSANSENTTHPVGQKKPNAWGLYDMQGNVWEWCSDWYGTYSEGLKKNPTGQPYGASRVLRGGSWAGYTLSTRSGRRFFSLPSVSTNEFGLRAAWERTKP
jgi:formylglycine-generating enzyme required for sulfatase activity